MSSICENFSAHHKYCDDAYALAEAAVAEGRYDEARAALRVFVNRMRIHLTAEEEQLFPAFESATGMTGGPTAVMRMEHEQLRALFDDLNTALEKRDADGFAGAGETLLILMQQHNLKEENMLYPMCDRVLDGDRPLLDRLIDAIRAGG